MHVCYQLLILHNLTISEQSEPISYYEIICCLLLIVYHCILTIYVTHVNVLVIFFRLPHALQEHLVGSGEAMTLRPAPEVNSGLG